MRHARDRFLTVAAAAVLAGQLAGCHQPGPESQTKVYWDDLTPEQIAGPPRALAAVPVQLGAGDVFGQAVYESYLAHVAPPDAPLKTRLAGAGYQHLRD